MFSQFGFINDIPGEAINVSVVKRELRATAADSITVDLVDEQDWHVSIIKYLTQPPFTVVVKDLTEFTLANGALYL